MRQPQGMIKCPSAQAPMRTGGQTGCCWSQRLGGGGGGGRWLPGRAAPRPSGTFSLPSRWPPAGLTHRAPCGALSTRRRGGVGGDEAPALNGRGLARPVALALPGLRTVPATGHASRNICAVRVEFSSFRPRSQGVILTPRAGHVGLPLFDKAAEDVSVWRHKDARNPVWTHCTLSPGTQSALRGRGFRILRFN